MTEKIVYELAEITTIIPALFTQFKGKKIILLQGEMGAGKTTLIKEICKTLRVQDSLASPTYGLVHEYKINNQEKIFHFDLYRLKNTEESIAIGIEDYFFSGHLCLVEWPDLILPLLKKEEFVMLKLETLSESKRAITFLN